MQQPSSLSHIFFLYTYKTLLACYKFYYSSLTLCLGSLERKSNTPKVDRAKQYHNIHECTKDKDYKYTHLRFYFNTCFPFWLNSTLYFLNQFTNALDLVPLEIIHHTGMTTCLPGYTLENTFESPHYGHNWDTTKVSLYYVEVSLEVPSKNICGLASHTPEKQLSAASLKLLGKQNKVQMRYLAFLSL